MAPPIRTEKLLISRQDVSKLGASGLRNKSDAVLTKIESHIGTKESEGILPSFFVGERVATTNARSSGVTTGTVEQLKRDPQTDTLNYLLRLDDGDLRAVPVEVLHRPTSKEYLKLREADAVRMATEQIPKNLVFELTDLVNVANKLQRQDSTDTRGLVSALGQIRQKIESLSVLPKFQTADDEILRLRMIQAQTRVLAPLKRSAAHELQEALLSVSGREVPDFDMFKNRVRRLKDEIAKLVEEQ